ncbi:MAG: RuBisCO large subunit C-terminal-like domain-containing protein [Candidatus Hydrothermarchaeales archaeon]
MGREAVDIVELASRHDPEKSLSLIYYVETKSDLIKVAKEVARDETTGSWIGQGNPTQLFLNSQADVYKIERFGPSEGVIYVRSPVSNLNLDSDLLYQIMMLTIGGPVLEFVYYDKVAFLDFDLPDALLERFSGPKFGLKGTKKLLSIPDDELIIGTIVKPCAGLSWEEVAERCYQAALGGVRFIKDDEKMLGPSYCPLEKKVKLICQKLGEATQKTGRKTIYAPHLVASSDKMKDTAKRLVEHGASALMFNPLATGLALMYSLASDPDINVPLYAHSGSRSGWSTGHRRVDDVVLAKLIRLAGGDYFQIGVMGQMNVHVASRTPELLLKLHKVLSQPWGRLKDTASVAAGGLNAVNLVDNIRAFGQDFIGLAGSYILKHPLGIKAGVNTMYQAKEAAQEGIPLEEYAQNHKELKVALNMQRG